MPLNSTAVVPDNCSGVSLGAAKLKSDSGGNEDTGGGKDLSVETEQSTDTALPRVSSSSGRQSTSSAVSTTPGDDSTESASPVSTFLSARPTDPLEDETPVFEPTDDSSSFTSTSISTLLPAEPTALLDNDAVTDEGYRAEGGSVTSSGPAPTPPVTQTDSSQTTPPTTYNAPSETQTILQPEETPPPSDNTTSAIASEVYRHRAQSAVNLGFWFVAEEYGTPEYFKGCATNDTAELNIAEGCTKEYMEDFWRLYVTFLPCAELIFAASLVRRFITEKDFAAMAELGINTVRLPVSIIVTGRQIPLTRNSQVGYWSVGKDNCHCENTPFWPFIDKYESQWSYVLRAIEWAAKYNIGVLVDFHAAEGSQNGWG